MAEHYSVCTSLEKNQGKKISPETPKQSPPMFHCLDLVHMANDSSKGD